ncbi:hypothetical protein JAAARDRAFT_498157 [Jaapia argillacea MUCL 33604]|uniref:Uncharacterized protein n=1 Tax=Jaapia argillacea MUCL 33604 TaxID=933084 RepID=A0A067PN56_9AGAM|nr:hypothetical protein JAAARDRAFT_498157 [Jaapia argillacea MUCL 33604]
MAKGVRGALQVHAFVTASHFAFAGEHKESIFRSSLQNSTKGEYVSLVLPTYCLDRSDLHIIPWTDSTRSRVFDPFVSVSCTILGVL